MEESFTYPNVFTYAPLLGSITLNIPDDSSWKFFSYSVNTANRQINIF